METKLIDIVTEEFRTWLQKHPARATAALEGLGELEPHVAALPPSQMAAITDLNNLLAKALGRD